MQKFARQDPDPYSNVSLTHERVFPILHFRKNKEHLQEKGGES
jgi:hypothetical protein